MARFWAALYLPIQSNKVKRCLEFVMTFCVSRRRREMYIGHTRLCVCSSLHCLVEPYWINLHYCTDPDVVGGMVGVPSSCSLLGGFAIGARVSLLRQQRRTRNVSECLYLLYAWFCLSSLAGACQKLVDGFSWKLDKRFAVALHWDFGMVP